MSTSLVRLYTLSVRLAIIYTYRIIYFFETIIKYIILCLGRKNPICHLRIIENAKRCIFCLIVSRFLSVCFLIKVCIFGSTHILYRFIIILHDGWVQFADVRIAEIILEDQKCNSPPFAVFSIRFQNQVPSLLSAPMTDSY